MMELFPAAAGLSAISLQLETYRWEDHVRRMRALNQEASSLAAANAQLDLLIGEYNDLARRFDGLASAMRELAPQVGELERRVQAQYHELHAKDARITELEEQLRRSRIAESFLRDQALTQTFVELDELRERERRQEALRSQQS